MSDLYGPALPPGFNSAQSRESEEKDTLTTSYGPMLPTSARTECPGGSVEVYGPVAPQPPSVDSKATDAAGLTYGPKLLEGGEIASTQTQSDLEERVSGPCVAGTSTENKEESDDIIGPVPITQQQKEQLEKESTRADFEARAKQMKNQLSGKGKVEPKGPEREEWMTQLPPHVKAFRLGPRKFRTRDVELGDRSVWTDTPADRLRKQQESSDGRPRVKKKEMAATFISDRDEKLSAQVSEYNKACRSESLMEMHRKGRAEEEAESQKTRRPFDREIDLKLPQNIVTPAKRQALMKDSAASLKNKFSHGTQQFL